MSKRYAFTLSELLIAIVILGVVAALTVPAVMNITMKQEFKTRLRKTYSSLAHAMNLSYGYYVFDDYRDWDYGHNNQFTEDVFEMIRPQLSVIKVCGRKYNDNECFAPAKAKNGKPALFFTENGFAANYAHLYTFVLNDGTSVAMDVWYDTSIANYAGVSKKLIVESDNLIFLVDVNGVKKPNMLGKDVHMFVLTENGLVPAGADNNSKYCEDTSVTYNYDCTAKMLKEF